MSVPGTRSRALLAAAMLWMLAAGERTAAQPSHPGRDVVVLDVPFLPQPPELCGGAALAMVQRYWGESAVYAEDYRDLVDPDLGGISTARLVQELRERGWRAVPFRANRELVQRHLTLGRPIVALLDGGASSLHYVVLAGSSGERLVLHDPALGPWRVRSASDVFASWETADFWALLILPPETSRARSEAAREPAARWTRSRSACGPLVAAALARGDETAVASELLVRAHELCPEDPVVARELAGLRFRGKDWSGAASFAARSVRLDASDRHAWSLLGASRFLDGDRDGALEAWNVIEGPEIDAVEIAGLERSRQDAVYRYLGLTPGDVLARDLLDKARRRARELPSSDGARLSFEPITAGRARVRARFAEGGLTAPLGPLLARSSVEALVDREARLELRSPARGGEKVDVGARFWSGRPAFRVSLAAPRMLGLPGVGTLSAFIERQSYAVSGVGAPAREERRRGMSLRVADWVTPRTKLEVGVGVQLWERQGDWIDVAVALDRRLLDDRLSLRANVGRSLALNGRRPFHEGGISARARLPLDSGWTIRGRLDVRGVSANAPLGVWSRAGTGRAGGLLLRGYPLLSGSVVDGEGFAPSMLHGSIELERQVWNAGVAAVGVAPFYDWARPWGRPGASSRNLSSVGVGARIHLWRKTLRVDGALRPEDGRFVFSVGWMESW